jgi:hypothetical protein
VIGATMRRLGRDASGNLDFPSRVQPHSRDMQFYLLAPGARFEFRGRQFVKIGITMARDSERVGTIFQGGAEVTPIGELLLLPEAEAARWKPSDIPWTAGMVQSPVAMSWTPKH